MAQETPRPQNLYSDIVQNITRPHWKGHVSFLLQFLLLVTKGLVSNKLFQTNNGNKSIQSSPPLPPSQQIYNSRQSWMQSELSVPLITQLIGLLAKRQDGYDLGDCVQIWTYVLNYMF